MGNLTAWAKISNWTPDQEIELSPNVRIVRKPLEEIVSTDGLKRWFGPHEIYDLEGLHYWICHEFSGAADSETVDKDREANGVLDSALMAVELLKPLGTMNARFVVADLAGQPHVRTVFRGAWMTEPIWARVSHVQESELQGLPKLFGRGARGGTLSPHPSVAGGGRAPERTTGGNGAFPTSRKTAGLAAAHKSRVNAAQTSSELPGGS